MSLAFSLRREQFLKGGNVRKPRRAFLSFAQGRIPHNPVQPGREPFRIAKCSQTAQDIDPHFLDGVFGVLRIAEDILGNRKAGL